MVLLDFFTDEMLRIVQVFRRGLHQYACFCYSIIIYTLMYSNYDSVNLL